jgi:hypothetical protein
VDFEHTSGPARSMSRRSSACHSSGRSPVRRRTREAAGTWRKLGGDGINLGAGECPDAPWGGLAVAARELRRVAVHVAPQDTAASRACRRAFIRPWRPLPAVGHASLPSRRTYAPGRAGGCCRRHAPHGGAARAGCQSCADARWRRGARDKGQPTRRGSTREAGRARPGVAARLRRDSAEPTARHRARDRRRGARSAVR